LQAIIQHGMELLRNIDWRHGDSALPSTFAAQTGIDLSV
jgi:hypothetical protein